MRPLARGFHRCAVVLVACMSAWSCKHEAPQVAEAQSTVRDSAGITIVFNHTDGSARGCVTIAADPEFVIGEGDESHPLYGVRGGLVLGDGRIVVLNAGNKELLFFEADGRLQRAVGRSGSGPGEFQDPRWLGRGPGDTLLVWDGRLQRISVFDPQGELVGLHQVRIGDDQGKPIAISGRFDDGSFLSTPGGLVFFDGTPGILRLPEPYGRYDTATGTAELLAEGAGMEFVSGSGRIDVLPFGKRDVTVALGDALVVGDNGTSTLRYYDLEGRLRRLVRWESEPVPVTARDRRAYVRDFNSGVRWRQRLSLDQTRFAAERPRFSGMMRDRDGWLWVRSYHADWERSGPWLVFDQDGVLRCSVDPPKRRFWALYIGASRVLGWRRDKNDEEQVVLYSLARHP